MDFYKLTPQEYLGQFQMIYILCKGKKLYLQHMRNFLDNNNLLLYSKLCRINKGAKVDLIIIILLTITWTFIKIIFWLY